MKKTLALLLLAGFIGMAFSYYRNPQGIQWMSLKESVLQGIRNMQFRTASELTSTTLWESQLGTPGFIRGNLTEASRDKPEVIAGRFLTQNRELLKLKDARNKFDLRRIDRDELGISHVRFIHSYEGLQVWPEDVVVHVNSEGIVYCFNGTFKEIALPDTRSAIAGEEAARAALKAFPCQVGANAELELVVYTFRVEQPILAWKVELNPKQVYPYRRLVFVDAHSGKIINDIDMVMSGSPTTSTGFLWNNQYPNGQAVSINAWRDDDGKIYLVDASKPMFPGTIDLDTWRGVIIIIETNHTDTSVSGRTYPAFDPNNDNVFNDSAEVVETSQASYVIGKTYDYFKNTHNRNSIDGSGMGIKVFTNFRQEAGQGMDNAFWNGKEIVLGDGGQVTYNWAGAADLTAHEFTHGVTTSTSNLVYQFESGALNESMSDVFGACVERSNWMIGENIVRPGIAPALRNMADPHNGQSSPDSPFWQPAHVSEFQNYPANKDNGGVHKNSSIPNAAFYRAATAIGVEKAEKIWYRGYSYMTQNTDFKGARKAFEQSTIDLHGQGSAELAAVRKAFDDVGISGDAQPATGQNYLYYPMATNFQHYGRRMNTSYSFANPGDTVAQFKAEEFKIDGTLALTANGTLNAKSMKYYQVNNATNFVKVTSDKRLIGFYETLTPDGSSWACTTASETYSNGVFVPHITYPQTDGWFTLAGVSNVAAVPSNVVYVDNADKGATININSQNQTIFFDFYDHLYVPVYGTMPDTSRLGGLWGLIANYDLAANKVLQANMVAGEMFGTVSGSGLASLTLSAESARTLLFSHITSPSQGWWTGIALICLENDPNLNDSVTTVPIKVTAYNSSGKAIKETITHIPYMGKLAPLTHLWKEGNDFIVPEGTVWLQISYMSEGNFLSGYEVFAMDAASGDTVAGIEAAARVSKKIYFPQIITGKVDAADFWSGIAIINPNDAPANLTYKLYNQSGQLIKTATKTIGPYCKDVGLAHELFGNVNVFGWLEVESSANITGFTVFAFSDGRATAGISPILGQ